MALSSRTSDSQMTSADMVALSDVSIPVSGIFFATKVSQCTAPHLQGSDWQVLCYCEGSLYSWAGCSNDCEQTVKRKPESTHA